MGIEYRWAENRTDRLPALAAELVRRQIAVIATAERRLRPLQPRRQPDDPHCLHRWRRPGQTGLVASLARPDSNLTGINFFNCRAVGEAAGTSA